MIKENLFRTIPAARAAEVFETIIQNKGLTLERIISHGQATPAGEWLSQERDEWVLLARGQARLRFEKEGEISLEPGDYVHIPAGTSHRVEWTDPEIPSIWLALHYEAASDMTERAREGRIQKIKVIRSARRKKTVGARLYGGTMYIYAPKNIAETNLRQMIKQFTRRFEKSMLKKQLNSAKNLRQIAEELNTKYFNGSLEIDSIQYVTDQTSKFGCCDCRARAIRISHRIAEMPDWVRDYVVMHEICHLREPGHGKAFWELVKRYPRAERAKGFLMARGLDLQEE
jgi:predicted metal-dependent hydrolase